MRKLCLPPNARNRMREVPASVVIVKVGKNREYICKIDENSGSVWREGSLILFGPVNSVLSRSPCHGAGEALSRKTITPAGIFPVGVRSLRPDCRTSPVWCRTCRAESVCSRRGRVPCPGSGGVPQARPVGEAVPEGPVGRRPGRGGYSSGSSMKWLVPLTIVLVRPSSRMEPLP